MRIHPISDLHLEFAPYPVPCPDVDVVVVAGDVHTKGRGPKWLREWAGDREVLYVGGNHDHWKWRRMGYEYPGTHEKLARLCAEYGIHWMDRSTVVLGGVRFLGATLWTDFALYPNVPLNQWKALEGMNDYLFISVPPGFRAARPSDTVYLHAQDRAWIEAELATPFDGPTIVLTHHAPCEMSLRSWRQRSDPLDPAYASRLGELVMDSGARYWIHGHTHHCVRYELGATTVLANCRGYGNSEGHNFDPALVLDV